MNARLRERRLEMMKLLSFGSSLTVVVKDLAKVYQVTERAIYRDYSNRKAWMAGFLGIKDPQVFLMDLLSTHREIKRLATREYLVADNSSARIGALKLLRDLNMDFHTLISTVDLQRRVEGLEMMV